LVLDSLVDLDPWHLDSVPPGSLNTHLNNSAIVGKKCLYYAGEDSLYFGLRVKVDPVTADTLPNETVIYSLSIGLERWRVDSIREDTLHYYSCDTVYTAPIVITRGDAEGYWGEYFTDTLTVYIDEPCNFLSWWDTTACDSAKMSGTSYRFVLPLYSVGKADFWVDYVEVYSDFFNQNYQKNLRAK